MSHENKRQFLEKPFIYKRLGGYECSSIGDKRFSAFYAIMPDGRNIECHFQCDVKGYDPGGTNWRLGKGKPPLDTTKDTLKEYVDLWRSWGTRHQSLIEYLYTKVSSEHAYLLSDRFSKTICNQAYALSILLNELHEKKEKGC